MREEEIQALNDDRLLKSLEQNLEHERKRSHIVLLHLKEIQARRLYAKRGFENLFRMLIERFRLSETSANQRLKALDFLVEVPQLEACLVNGEVNLSTLALAQRQINREEKVTGKKVSPEVKEEIAFRITNKTQRETEIELMQILPESATAPKTYEKRVSKDAVRMNLTIPDSLREKLVRLKEIWAHVDPAMDFVEVIDRMADITLAQVDPALRKSKKKTSGKTPAVKSETESQRATDSVAQRKTYYGVDVDHVLWTRADSQCEYIDVETGRRCTCRFGLQRDHIVPLAMGGSNDLSNLRLLCRTHNDLEARRHFGNTKMDREILGRRKESIPKQPTF